MLEEVIKYVNECFEKSVNHSDYLHFERTVHWLKELKQDADEPMHIAAYAHDIERAFRKVSSAETFKDRETDDKEYMADYQEEGARIITKFLMEKNYDSKAIDRVYNMVRHHEEGGDPESDFIKDADSLSYFEVNAEKHIKKLAPILGKDKIRRKFYFMYNRISSLKAKEIAKPMYDKAIASLDST